MNDDKAYFVNALQNRSIYEMYFPAADAVLVITERLEGSDLGNEFCDVGESR
jgi:hypothetical protein